MKRNRNDIIAEIKTARNEARIKANAYRHLTVKRYDYWRATVAIAVYDQALDMFERGAEHEIPSMATEALADFEYAREGEIPVPKLTLVATDERRDVFAAIAEWMRTEENNS